MPHRENVHWHIVVNSHAGTGQASKLVKSLIRMIAHHDIDYSVHDTQSTNDGLRLAKVMVRHTAVHLPNTVIAIVGGDGTLHDLVNGIMQLDPHPTSRGVRFALVPSGTANAVYHSLFPETCKDPGNFDRFLSVKEALNVPGSVAPLSVCRISTNPNSEPTYACVVASTCLHADILETASTKEMREAYPGVERFKKAAEQHLGTAYSAKLTLHPVTSQNPRIHRWSIEHDQWEGLSPDSIVIEGQFAYFVSALVDRFETAFRIAPYSSPVQGRPAEAVDIVLVKYREDLSKEENAQRLVNVLMSAYKDGAHINLTEERDGKTEAIVDYYRVGSFEWQPLDEPAKLICLDGDTSRLSQGFSLKSEVKLQGGSGVDVDAFQVFC